MRTPAPSLIVSFIGNAFLSECAFLIKVDHFLLIACLLHITKRISAAKQK